MSEYKFFATVYDRMMDNIPYEEWEQYLLQILYRFNVRPDATITEIGCGTGTITEMLADDGFSMTGIDLSEDMLNEARKKNLKKKSTATNESLEKDFSDKQPCFQKSQIPDITYLHMDMRELVLPEKQDVIISISDSMNYLLTNDDLYRTMKAVRKNLKEDGLFVFDLKTEYFFKTALDGNTYKEDLGDFSYLWKNYYDEEKHIHSYYLWFKLYDKNKTKLIRKLCSKHEPFTLKKEHHRQRAFSAADIKEAALKAGFDSATVYGDFSFMKPCKKCERYYVIMRNSK